jgi:hypothetical protein
MKDGKVILYIAILLAVVAGSLIGYRAAQNKRYEPFGPDNLFLWDNWESKPLLNDRGAAKQIYEAYYKE